MKLVVFVLLLSSVFAAPGCLISDYEFTNQDYTWRQFLGVFSNFPGCSLTYPEKEIIFRCARVRGVSVIVLLAKIQQESDLVLNLGGTNRYAWRKDRAMGYGMIRQWREPHGRGDVKFWKYGGYYIQVWLATERLRAMFDGYNGIRPAVLGDGTHVVISNAASDALYRYTPYYGLHDTHGYHSRGNELFQQIYKRFVVLFFVLQ